MSNYFIVILLYTRVRDADECCPNCCHAVLLIFFWPIISIIAIISGIIYLLTRLCDHNWARFDLSSIYEMEHLKGNNYPFYCIRALLLYVRDARRLRVIGEMSIKNIHPCEILKEDFLDEMWILGQKKQNRLLHKMKSFLQNTIVNSLFCKINF